MKNKNKRIHKIFVLLISFIILGIQSILARPALALDKLVSSGTTWKYNATGTDLGTAWRESAYSETGWLSGASELGYGDGSEPTIVSSGPDPYHKYSTYYFRKSFNANPANYVLLTLKVIRDDGIVVYLNGNEVYRDNMPVGTITYDTWASSEIPDGSDESTWINTNIALNNLVTGTNVLAVEVHIRSGGDGDMSFNCELIGHATDDTTAPSTPTDLTATAASVTQINLTWTASTDNVGVTGYNIYRNGGTTPIGSSVTTSYSSTQLSPGTTYTYTVAAYDAEGNESSKSTSASATTFNDTTAPTAPTNLTATTFSTSQINLSWTASSDDVAVTGYNIYRNGGGTPIGTSTTTSYADTNLSAATTYTYTVTAYDAAGNESLHSTSASETTFLTVDEFIASNSAWKYNDTGTDLGTGWREIAYGDSGWTSGNAELGYGDGGEGTVISYGPDSNNKYPTYYFRRSFDVAVNPALYAVLTLRVVRDDGIVVYLNGVEVYRNNMPAGTITYNTLASTAIAGADESAWYETNISTSNLVAGTNVLAVEVHQNLGTSTDLSFNCQLFAGRRGTETVITKQNGAPAYISKGATNKCLGTFRLAGVGTVSAMTITEYGTSNASSDLENIKLYQDDGDGIWELDQDTTQLGVTTNFDANSKASFSGFSLAAGNNTYAHVVLDVKPGITDLVTIGIEVNNVADVTCTETVSSSSWPVQLGVSTVSQVLTVSKHSSGDPVVPPSGVNVETANQCLGTFKFSGDGQATGLILTLYGATSKYHGTIDPQEDLGNVKLFQDDGDGNWEISEDTTQLGVTTNFDANSKAGFSGFSIAAGNNTFVHVVLDVTDAILKDDTFGIEILYGTDVSATVGVDANSWPVQLGATTVKTIYPYLQDVTQNSIKVMWKTDTAQESRVDYGLTSDYGSTVNNANLVNFHEILISGLATNTIYHYKVTSGSISSADCIFRTAPASNSGFTFIQIGDNRTEGSGDSYSIYFEPVSEAINQHNPYTLIVNVGDVDYTGALVEWQPMLFLPGRNILKNNASYIAIGNHEYGSAEGPVEYQNYCAPPSIGGSGSEFYYSFNYGNTHFITVDSNQNYDTGSAQYNWLASDLDSPAATNAKWIIVSFHHPLYSSNMSYPAAGSDREHLEQLLASKGVDLVLTGHSHFYERHYKDGVYHVVSGGAGARLVDPGANTQYMEFSKYYTYQHCLITAGNTTITVTAYDTNNNVLDAFTLPKNPPLDYGNVDQSGDITAYDAALTAQHSVGLGNLTAEQIILAEVSNNSQVSAYDASLIAQYAVGLIDIFPVQGPQ